MASKNQTPEQKARNNIDVMLKEAGLTPCWRGEQTVLNMKMTLGQSGGIVRDQALRQAAGDKRSFIYEVDPAKFQIKPKPTSADWSDIHKASTRIRVCTDQQVKLVDKRS
jgi:hypothetical protein